MSKSQENLSPLLSGRDCNVPFSSLRQIRIRGVERLADVRMIYQVADPETGRLRIVERSYLNRASRLTDGFAVQFDRVDEMEDLAKAFGGVVPPIAATQTLVAAASQDWPALEGIPTEVVALPNVVTNVEGGVGYLGGVVTKTAFWP